MVDSVIIPALEVSKTDRVREWAEVAARAAADKGGEETVVLAVGEMLAITDAFVITAAANTRQVRTIAEEIEARVKTAGGPSPIRTEGLDDATWALIDFGDFVVHIFLTEVREFYELERLWGNAEQWIWNGGPAEQLEGLATES